MPPARDQATRPAAARPAVLLLHTLPSGASHFDWLTARAADPDAPLLAFRVGVRIDRLAPGAAFDAERLPDHRPLYLSHEGPLEPKNGADRGAVRRLAEAHALIERDDPGGLAVSTDWGRGRLRAEGAPIATGLWRFTLSQPD